MRQSKLLHYNIFLIIFCLSTVYPNTKPNIILIFCDDLGYGDVSCYSSRHDTPNIDKMASEGVKFTDFYTSSSVCTPSRASLLTGCYSQRIDMNTNEKGECVLFPNSPKGLNPDEVTIAEILKEQNYATACIGKWHLGDQESFLPLNQGFDYYYGIPYSNDHNRDKIPLPLVENYEVIEAPVDQSTITKRYTQKTIEFIEEHKNETFFIYLPHTFPHFPLYASEDFLGKTGNGTFGDAIAELDCSTGEILKTICKLNLDKTTLVIFTSDNGGHYYYGGNNLPLFGNKGETWEGGQRVPMIAWWPGVIPAGKVSIELCTTMDLLPTIANLANAELPAVKIDGKNIISLMTNPESSKSPHEVFYYYQIDQLQAIRYGDWKLFLAMDNKRQNWGKGLGKTDFKLYNLHEDINEMIDLSDSYPDLVEKINGLAKYARDELGDHNIKGKAIRKAGFVQDPKPLLKQTYKHGELE